MLAPDKNRHRLAMAVGLLLLSLPAVAQPPLSLELNSVTNEGSDCQLTFVVNNGLGTDIRQLVLETVLFSSKGEVLLLTLFDFAAVPASVPRVRQFVVNGSACDDIQQILINGVNRCEGPEDPELCRRTLQTSSRARIKVVG